MERRKTFVAGIAASIAVLASLAGPAYAQSTHPATEKSRQAPTGAVGVPDTKCGGPTNGELCVNLFRDSQGQGILVRYDKCCGSEVTARVGWKRAGSSDSTATWDSTWYKVERNEYITRTWRASYPCNYEYEGLLQVSGQGVFRTPDTAC